MRVVFMSLYYNHHQKYFAKEMRKMCEFTFIETMNSACAVVASNEMGSAPYLISNGENGLLYFNNNEDELYEKVKFLLDSKEKREEISINAYNTVAKEWNAQKASENLLCLIDAIINRKSLELFEKGVCSRA